MADIKVMGADGAMYTRGVGAIETSKERSGDKVQTWYKGNKEIAEFWAAIPDLTNLLY